MTDLDLGMNNWMADAFDYPKKPIDRGKVLTAEDLEKLGGFAPLHATWMAMASATARCPAPTIHRDLLSRAAAATTIRPNTPSAKTITSTTWIAWRTSSKSCASIVPEPVMQERRGRQNRLHRASAPPITRCAKAATSCATNTRSHASYMRLKAYPFTSHLLDYIRRHDRVYVVDQNRDAPVARPRCAWNSMPT